MKIIEFEKVELWEYIHNNIICIFIYVIITIFTAVAHLRPRAAHLRPEGYGHLRPK